jgi:hypothetical protein
MFINGGCAYDHINWNMLFERETLPGSARWGTGGGYGSKFKNLAEVHKNTQQRRLYQSIVVFHWRYVPGIESKANRRMFKSRQRVGTGGSSKVSILLSLIIILAPMLIIWCCIRALQHTLIIRNEKRRDKMSTALIASMWESNGPDRKWGVR